MNWLNLEIKKLRSPEYIGSSPTERATWIGLLAYCCEQENGGYIVGASLWKDRQWQQLCGVTGREVRAADKLLEWDGDDLIVSGYPHSKEEEVKMRREFGRSGGIKSGELRLKQNRSSASSLASVLLERKEKEKEKENNTAATPLSPLFQIEGFREEWGEFVAYRKKIKKPMTDHAADLTLRKLMERPDSAISALQMAMEKGWRSIEWEWFDKNAPVHSQPKAYWQSTHPDALRPQDELLREAFIANHGDNPKAQSIIAKLTAVKDGQTAPLDV